MEQHQLGMRPQQVGSMMGVAAEHHVQTPKHFLALSSKDIAMTFTAGA